MAKLSSGEVAFSGVVEEAEVEGRGEENDPIDEGKTDPSAAMSGSSDDAGRAVERRYRAVERGEEGSVRRNALR